jgi:hypothetical protein
VLQEPFLRVSCLRALPVRTRVEMSVVGVDVCALREVRDKRDGLHKCRRA